MLCKNFWNSVWKWLDLTALSHSLIRVYDRNTPRNGMIVQYNKILRYSLAVDWTCFTCVKSSPLCICILVLKWGSLFIFKILWVLVFLLLFSLHIYASMSTFEPPIHLCKLRIKHNKLITVKKMEILLTNSNAQSY